MVRDIVKTILVAAVPLAAFATGLRAASTDVLWLARHPALLLRSLLAILVLVPVGTVLFLHTTALTAAAKAGIAIAVVAVGIGPPAAFKRTKTDRARAQAHDQAHDQAIAYELGLNLLLLTLAIAYVPAAVALHGAALHHELGLAPAVVGKVVLGGALVPVAAGVVVGRLLPRLVAPIRDHVGTFVQIVLLIKVAAPIVTMGRQLIGIGGRTWLACAAVALGALAAGHVLGGPERQTRPVLAAFSAIRFPALALLLASAAPRGADFTPVIVAYVITSFALAAIYERLLVWRAARAPASPRRTATARRPSPGSR